jgi:hypothetical protein
MNDDNQPVRWNGFDALDIAAFAMDEEVLKAEPALQNRLSVRYWQCMEELCKRFDYIILASRSEDWDFTPRGFNIIGNTGIGYWECENLTAKWCVGWHAWEMDMLMAKQALKEKGERACEQLAADLTESRIAQGLTVGIQAVQRFQYATATDSTWFGESSFSIAGTQNAADTLKSIWNQELAMLNGFHNRRGLEVTSAEALEIKRDIFKIREPHNPNLPSEMKTKHETWKLFAALNVFVHIAPDIFSKGMKGAFMTKEEQLDEMDKIIRLLASFAEQISI